MQPVEGVNADPRGEARKCFAAAIKVGPLRAPSISLLAEAHHGVADRAVAHSLTNRGQRGHAAHRVHGHQGRFRLLCGPKQPFQRGQIHRQRLLGHDGQAAVQADARPGRYPVVAAATCTTSNRSVSSIFWALS